VTGAFLGGQWQSFVAAAYCRVHYNQSNVCTSFLCFQIKVLYSKEGELRLYWRCVVVGGGNVGVITGQAVLQCRMRQLT
jgi:hypothetical protein